jgi:uncharacterized membrane protein YeaQ/YmgE (transglycosylase-associated protein family)
MHIFWMLLVGLVVGTVARLLMPGRAGGIIMTVLLGLAGSFLAGLLGRSIGWYRGGLDAPGLCASVLGAMLILSIFGRMVGRRGRGSSAEV